MRTWLRLIAVALLTQLGFAQKITNIATSNMASSEMASSEMAGMTMPEKIMAGDIVAAAIPGEKEVFPPSDAKSAGTAEHLNGTYYLADCAGSSPASWCAGADVGAWINAAVANCPKLFQNFAACNIVLPEANNEKWNTPALVSSPGISVFGYGSHDSTFDCSVSNGACLTIRDSWNFTTEKGGRLQGFRINGNPGANAVGIEIVDYQGLTLRDLVTANFTGPGGTGFYWYVVSHWIEENNASALDTSNNTIAYRLGSAKSPSSFGYNTFINLHCYINAGQICFSVENSASAYHGFFSLQINKAGSSANAIAVNVQDHAIVLDGTFLLYGEDQDTRVNGLLFRVTPEATFRTNYQVFWEGSKTPSSIEGKWQLLSTNWTWAPNGANMQYQPWKMTADKGGTLYCPYFPPSACTVDLQGYAQVGRDSSNGIYLNTQNGERASDLQRFHIDTAGHVTFPNTTSITGPNIPLIGSFTTTSSAADRVEIAGVTPASHCWLQPTNAGAAGGLASVFVSARAANQITVNHAPAAGWTFDVFCTPN